MTFGREGGGVVPHPLALSVVACFGVNYNSGQKDRINRRPLGIPDAIKPKRQAALNPTN